MPSLQDLKSCVMSKEELEKQLSLNGSNNHQNHSLDLSLQKAYFHQKEALSVTQDIVYIVEQRKWYQWNGYVYQQRTEEVVINKISDRLRKKYASYCEKTNYSNNEYLNRLKELNNYSIVKEKILPFLRGEPRIARSLHDFDVKPFVLNTPAGYINFLQNGDIEFVPHNPDAPKDFLRATAVPYDPNATCDTFMTFLYDIFLDNQELVDFFQQVMGLFLLGHNIVTKAFVFYGNGRNGKSTLTKVIMGVLGDNYTGAMPHILLTKNYHNEHNFAYASLVGKRLVVLEELNDRDVINTKVIKDLISDDVKTCRFLYQEYFNYQFSINLVINTNFRPNLSSYTEGDRRRLIMIPFEKTIPKEQMIDNYNETLLKEASGILNFMIEGLQRVLQNNARLKIPPIIERITAEGFTKEGSVEHFIWTYTEPATRKSIPLDELYQKYKEFASEYQEENDILNKIHFSRKLKALGYEVERKKIDGQKQRIVKNICFKELE